MYSVLRAVGVLPAVCNTLENMYSVASTYFKDCGGFNIRLKRGVKQGDPLLPLLSNLVLAP